MGVSVNDAYTAMELMLAPVFANDFVYHGRVLQVLLQADAPYRMGPDALRHYYLARRQRRDDPAVASISSRRSGSSRRRR